jgi:hypothetical protein
VVVAREAVIAAKRDGESLANIRGALLRLVVSGLERSWGG